MPKVSIITANYNSANYLKDTIDSVINQSFTDWEWLIVDDNSTDNSIEIINTYNEPRIKLLKNNKNLGAAHARNKALENAKGRFITFLDSDDLWKPNFLKTTTDFLVNKNETLVYCSYERVDENLNPILKDFKAIDKVDYQRILYNCPIPMLTAMYDTKDIGKIKIPIVEKREDHAMWIEILKKIPYARSINETLGTYRIREQSYSRNKFEILKFQFNLYNKYLSLPLHKSIFYTITWAINGFFKYR